MDNILPLTVFPLETFDIKSSKARKMTSRKETPPAKPKIIIGFLRGGVQGEGVTGEPWAFLGKIGEPLGNIRED